MGSKNPWADWAQICFDGRCPQRSHAVQIWWWSVQGFLVGWSSNSAFSHRLWRSSLQHSECYFSKRYLPYVIRQYYLPSFQPHRDRLVLWFISPEGWKAELGSEGWFTYQHSLPACRQSNSLVVPSSYVDIMEVKNVPKKMKNVKKRKNVAKIKKTFKNVDNKR